LRVLGFSLSRNDRKKNRHRLEIVRDVLSIVTLKARKTRIMYQANLSYPLLEKYLNRLLDSGMVECEDGICYLITRRGKEFLQMYNEFIEHHRRIREEITGVDKDRLLLENMVFNNDNNISDGNNNHFNSKRASDKKEVLV
jgi:predicted transcriptional regulator